MRPSGPTLSKYDRNRYRRSVSFSSQTVFTVTYIFLPSLWTLCTAASNWFHAKFVVRNRALKLLSPKYTASAPSPIAASKDSMLPAGANSSVIKPLYHFIAKKDILNFTMYLYLTVRRLFRIVESWQMA